MNLEFLRQSKLTLGLGLFFFATGLFCFKLAKGKTDKKLILMGVMNLALGAYFFYLSWTYRFYND